MALTGMQIFKLLPKTNCKECGVPTCLAFAMNLASGKAELDSCPYVSAESRAQLEEAAAPPIRQIAIGKGVRGAKIGGETVLYRHEKTFYNPTLFAGLISSDITTANAEVKLKSWNAIQYERVGLNLRPELVAVKDANGDKDSFAALAKLVAETSEFNVILMSEDAGVMAAGIAACSFKKPVIYAATESNADEFGTLALDNNLPLVVKADSIDGLIALTDKLGGMGLKDLILDPGSRELKQALQDQVALRRAALKAGNRSLGFPTISFPCEMASNVDMEALVASMYVSKYGGIVVLSDLTAEALV